MEKQEQSKHCGLLSMMTEPCTSAWLCAVWHLVRNVFARPSDASWCFWGPVGCSPALHAVAMQVLTACLKSFAHGANDTANAAGPFAAVQSLYLNTDTGCQGIGTPLWVLAFCGVGIVVVMVLRAGLPAESANARPCVAEPTWFMCDALLSTPRCCWRLSETV